jgi:hypothetical protein
MAAAASSLKSQAQELVQTVAVFQLGNTPALRADRAHRPVSSPVRTPLPPARKLAVGSSTHKAAPKRTSFSAAPKALAPPKPATNAPAAQSDDDWETF